MLSPFPGVPFGSQKTLRVWARNRHFETQAMRTQAEVVNVWGVGYRLVDAA
jgi:hypothetical protein